MSVATGWTLPEGQGCPGGRAGEGCCFSKPAGVTRSARGSQLGAGTPLPSPTHPPDLCGVELSCVQVHADEGAGQAAFAQCRLGRAQSLHIWWRGEAELWEGVALAPKGNREAEGGSSGAGGLMRGWVEEGGRGRLRGRDGQSRGQDPRTWISTTSCSHLGPRSPHTALL